MPIAESQAAALERLRMEFVQRASRTAGGSQLEGHLADAMTAELKDMLPHFDSSAEPLLHECFARIADAADYWSQQEINVSVSRQSFNALWEIPNRQITMGLPVSAEGLPDRRLPGSNSGSAQLLSAEQFLRWARESL